MNLCHAFHHGAQYCAAHVGAGIAVHYRDYFYCHIWLLKKKNDLTCSYRPQIPKPITHWRKIRTRPYTPPMPLADAILETICAAGYWVEVRAVIITEGRVTYAGHQIEAQDLKTGANGGS